MTQIPFRARRRFRARSPCNGPDGTQGFPDDLWSRQTTTIRSSNQLNDLETQVVAANARVFKEMGKREIATIFFGGGQPDKYRATGQTQPTDWQTGQPMLNADYITSPSTCAQTTFS